MTPPPEDARTAAAAPVALVVVGQLQLRGQEASGVRSSWAASEIICFSRCDEAGGEREGR